MTKNGIKVLDWPAQSPDLNPIEHVCGHIKDKSTVTQYNIKRTS